MPKLHPEIKQRLAEVGASQADLARKTGIDYKRINLWIGGLINIRPEEEASINFELDSWGNGSK